MTAVPARHLIVNADDFGQSLGVNDGVALAHEQGIVTSASLMVRWDAAAPAAAYARLHPDLSVGLHIDLGEWAYRDGTWVTLYEVVQREDRSLVAAEVERQLAQFRTFLGRNPTHLDSHQHLHRYEPVRSIVGDLAAQLDVPLRAAAEEIRYSNAFYGQRHEGAPLEPKITRDGLIEVLVGLEPGVTELGCHPGQGNDLDSMYGAERALEVATLCDPMVRDAIRDLQIQLCNFETRPRVRASA